MYMPISNMFHRANTSDTYRSLDNFEDTITTGSIKHLKVKNERKNDL